MDKLYAVYYSKTEKPLTECFKHKGIDFVLQTNTLKDLLLYCRNYCVDILVIDNSATGSEFFSLFDTAMFSVPNIILIDYFDQNLKQIETKLQSKLYSFTSNTVYNDILKNFDTLLYLSILRKGRRFQNLDIEKHIYDSLINLNFSPKHSGYVYLFDCIKLAIFKGNKIDSFAKHIYPLVAQKNKKSQTNTIRNIQNAIDNAFLRIKPEILLNQFGYTINPQKGKPTNKELIALIADKVLLQCY